MPENSSCTPQEPFIKLGDSNNGNNVPVLDYNLPQTSSFVANGYFPLKLDNAMFKTAVKTAPPDNYYLKVETAIAASNPVDVANKLNSGISNLFASRVAYSPISSDENLPASTFIPSTNVATAAVSLLNSELPISNNFEIAVAGVQTEKAANIGLNAMPVLRKNLAGLEVLDFIPKPAAVNPVITIVEHYRVNTYLGNYGAGETRKTFSLLPGEKTTISVKSWKTTTESKKQTENVLDSFNSESANDLENIAESESNSSSKNDQKKDKQVSGGLNIPIMGELGMGNLSASKNSSSQSVREQTTKTLNRAISKQAQKSVAQRKVEVNTETNISSTEGEETTVTRVLENLNKSRTLNFVFRQLNQELVTVTYLDDVTFVFSNGYPEAKRACKLDGLYELLTEWLNDTNDADDTYRYCINHLANVLDYKGDRRNFVSKFEEQFKDLFTAAAGTDINTANTLWTRDFFRKNLNLSSTQTFELKEGDASSAIAVNGIIVNVTRRVMPTDSLVVDALLGQGEALDCFSTKAQEADNEKDSLENLKITTGLGIIEDITDPVQKSEAYERMFNPKIISDEA